MSENKNREVANMKESEREIKLDSYVDTTKTEIEKEQSELTADTIITNNEISKLDNSKHTHFHTSTENDITFDKIIIDFDKRFYVNFNNEQQLDGITEEGLESYINLLLENNLLFIASDSKDATRNVAIRIFNRRFKQNHRLKKLWLDKSLNKSYALYDLTQALSEQDSILIVAEFYRYKFNNIEEDFLSSLTQNIHTNSINILRQRNIYLLLLVTDSKGCDILVDGEELQLRHSVWRLSPQKTLKTFLPELEGKLSEYNYLEKLALFVATYFDKLSLRDFDYIMNILIADAKTSEKIVLDIYKNFDTGAKKVKLVLEDELIKIWDIYKDKICSNCYLKGKSEGGTFVIEHYHPEQKPIIAEKLKEKYHFFWQAQCTILEESRLLFNPGVSENIASGVIDLIIQSLSDDQSYYDEYWFLRIIGEIHNSDGQPLQIQAEDSVEGQLLSLFTDIENRMELKRFFYHRLASILKKMFQKALEIKAGDFMQSLIRYRLHEQLFTIIKILSNLPEFNKFYWLKQLLDVGKTSEVKNNAYRWLVEVAASRYPAETWNVVKTWLPGTKKLAKYSPSNHYACFFVIHVYVNEIKRFPAEDYGKWPSAFSAFSSYDTDTGNSKEHLMFLMQQFLHEGTVYQFDNDNVKLLTLMTLELIALSWSADDAIRDFLYIDDDHYLYNTCLSYTPNYYTLLADIIETMFHILRGFDKNPAREANSLTIFWIEAVVIQIKTRPEFIGSMMKHWEKKAGEYAKQIKRLSEYKTNNDIEPDDEDNAPLDAFSISLKCRMHNMTQFFEMLNNHL